MTKQEFQKNFSIKVEILSNRAQNILRKLRLHDYENFYDYYVLQHKTIPFNKVQNCGEKTQGDLNKFVESILQHAKNISNEKETVDTIENSADKFQINKKLEIKFEEEFYKLKARTQNILSSVGVNEIKFFYEKIILNGNLSKILELKNCGIATYNEIVSFKDNIYQSLKSNKDSDEINGFFYDISLLFFRNKFFKRVELDIFLFFFGFVQNEKSSTLQEIAERNKLTKERVRQISFTVIDKIKGIAHSLFSKENYNACQYFQGNSFYIDAKFTYQINNSEKTNFSPSFITYVLEAAQHPSYYFICISNKMKYYSGVFVNTAIQFDFKLCFKFLSQYIDQRRKEDVKIKLDDLIQSYKRIQKENLFSNSEGLNLYDQMEILEVFKLFAEAISNDQNQVILNQDYIVFKRNTKKLKYEFLVEILDEYKKPMHFTELYEECVKKGIATSVASIHSMMARYPKIFGLKGPGIYGLLEWGGYFGTIGDVAEKLLNERAQPIDRKELVDILCRQLYISQDSINTVLFFYEPEQRFIKMKNDKIGLKEWIHNKKAI